MKRLILCGRDVNTTYRALRPSGWSYPKSVLIDQINTIGKPGTNDKKVTQELKQEVRYTISQVEDLEAKLAQYKQILETYNASRHTLNDAATLATSLGSFKF